jgi:hypothetical protein
LLCSPFLQPSLPKLASLGIIIICQALEMGYVLCIESKLFNFPSSCILFFGEFLPLGDKKNPVQPIHRTFCEKLQQSHQISRKHFLK